MLYLVNKCGFCCSSSGEDERKAVLKCLCLFSTRGCSSVLQERYKDLLKWRCCSPMSAETCKQSDFGGVGRGCRMAHWSHFLIGWRADGNPGAHVSRMLDPRQGLLYSGRDRNFAQLGIQGSNLTRKRIQNHGYIPKSKCWLKHIWGCSRQGFSM